MSEQKQWDLRIAVCVPGDRMKSGFVQALGNMLITFCNAKYDGGKKEIEVFNVVGSILPDIRHRCVAEATKYDATHMLFLDDDMLFPRDTLQQLLKHNVPVVGANYVRRMFPPIPTAYKADKSGKLYTKPGDTGLVEVSHVGTGCMLIDMRVFDQIELPYFAMEHDEGSIRPKGEDVYFCHKVRDAGIPVYCDQDLSKNIGHYGEFCFTNDMADVTLEAMFAGAVAYQRAKNEVESAQKAA